MKLTVTANADGLEIFPEGLRSCRILLCTESFGPVNGVSCTTPMLVNHLISYGVLVLVVTPYNYTKVNTFSPIKAVDKGKRFSYCLGTWLTGCPLPFNPELSVVYPLRQQVEEAQVPIICNFQTGLAGYCSILFPLPLGEIASWVFTKAEGYFSRHSSVFYPCTSVKSSVEKRCQHRGGFRPHRRSKELRKEWHRMEPHKRHLDFKLVIEIKDMFKPLSTKGKATFTGFKIFDDLMAYYASADVFLDCFVTKTFGLVVLEAMASGVPATARDRGGPSDTIKHGRTGFLVPPDDPKLRQQIGGSSRSRTEKESYTSMVAFVFTARQSVVGKAVEMKLLLGLNSLLTILGFGAGVSLYLFFANIVHLARTRAPRLRAMTSRR
ncbi:hypothetical protein F5X99DRAFT_422428 [Biscogniauxia marginata]|nr:hypothetical protein F5X99DRAFT_422428 [Biscogniauxia marginata]